MGRFLFPYWCFAWSWVYISAMQPEICTLKSSALVLDLNVRLRHISGRRRGPGACAAFFCIPPSCRLPSVIHPDSPCEGPIPHIPHGPLLRSTKLLRSTCRGTVSFPGRHHGFCSQWLEAVSRSIVCVKCKAAAGTILHNLRFIAT